MSEQKHPGGRPTKYTPDMCNAVIAVGEIGGCVAEMAVACEVTIATIYNWAKDQPEFLDALTRAQELAEAFHAKRIRDGLTMAPSEFQGPANLKYMAVRFNDRWSEKNRLELSGPNGGPIKTEEVSAREILAGRIAGLSGRKGEDGGA